LVEEDKFAAIAHTNWGIALFERNHEGDLDGAIAIFTLATKLDRENAGAYNSWGAALFERDNEGDLDGAIKKYTRATELDPEYVDAILKKAQLLRLLSRAAEAADAFQRYLDLKPNAQDAEQVRERIEELRADATND
jgi:tetratricopeptide (TPR) repeat protein